MRVIAALNVPIVNFHMFLFLKEFVDFFTSLKRRLPFSLFVVFDGWILRCK